MIRHRRAALSIYRRPNACRLPGYALPYACLLTHTHAHILYVLFSFFRLKLLAEQYQAREKHLEKLNEQVQLESQLYQAKLNKAKVEAAMEKDILTKWVTLTLYA